MPNFESLRVSLAIWEDTPLFSGTRAPPSHPDRRDVLSEIFSHGRNFLHRGRSITFVPVRAPKGYIAGYFGRELHIHGHSLIGASFKPEELETYDVALLVMDVASDQQIAYVQYNGNVGSPRPLLESFFSDRDVREISRDFQIHVKYLSSEQDYYDAAKKYAGQITKLVFTFIPPNALKSEELIWDLIREASREGGSESLKHEYDSPHGNLDPTSNILAGSERVAAAGGGETIMKSGRQTIFSSVRSKLSTYIPKNELPEAGNELQIAGFISWIFKAKK